jgi:hypothetical protein
MAERDPDTGQFLVGHSGIGGRPKGSRNKLGEAFLLGVVILVGAANGWL